MKHILLVLSAGFLASVAEAAPRQPFMCELDRSVHPTNGYESVRFEGILSPAESSLTYYYNVSDSDGRTTATSLGKESMDLRGDRFVMTLPNREGQPVTASLPNGFWSSGRMVKATLGEYNLLCSLFAHHATNLMLPPENFDLYNLPVEMQGRVEIKKWASSDGLFTFRAEKFWGAERTRHYPAVPPHTSLVVYIAGELTDDNPGPEASIHYLLFGETTKHVVRAELKNPADVANAREIFGATPVTLNLTHPYGHTSPITLTIDCTSSTCVLEARN